MVAVQANTDNAGMRADKHRYSIGANLDTTTRSVCLMYADGCPGLHQ